MEFLNPILGTPYGFETFVYSALDTASDNLFNPLNEGTVDLIYYFLDWIRPDQADLVLGQGIANRLGIPVYPPNKRADLYKIFSNQGKKFSDIYTIPEDDNFRYGADGHISRVCSCLAMDVCYF